MKWRPEYATGIDNIDDQHRQIVEIITEFEEISERCSRWHEFHPLIRRTAEFMKFHFLTEESLMQLLSYPECEARRADHERELKHIESIERAVLRGTIRTTVALQMRRRLFRHIRTTDKHLAQCALSPFGHGSSSKETKTLALTSDIGPAFNHLSSRAKVHEMVVEGHSAS